jgi:hypothetical protein
MRPFYLLSAAAIVAFAWLVYTKFLAKDPEPQPTAATPAQNVAVTSPTPRGLSPDQIRNRKEILRTYERQLRETTYPKDRKILQDKISAVQKELAGN